MPDEADLPEDSPADAEGGREHHKRECQKLSPVMRDLVREFRIRYPEFQQEMPTRAKATKTQIVYWIGKADEYLSPDSWPDGSRPEAVLRYAAFLLAMSLSGARGGSNGPVASASVGGQSVSYQTNNKYGQGTNHDDLLLMYPPYGPAYAAWRDQCMAEVVAGRT